MTERDEKISDSLVRLVQIIFAFVIAQSLGRYDVVVIDPFARGHWLAFLALLTVYGTTILSWIDWHTTMVLRPYAFNARQGLRRTTEQLRLFADLFVVSVYAYLLLTVVSFVGQPDAYIGRHLLGYPAVFVGYCLSGVLRQFRYGRLASNQLWIVAFGLAYAGVYATYALAFDHVADIDAPWLHGDRARFNLVTLVVVGLLMVAYRLMRRWSRVRRSRAKEQGLRIGFDVDGVLANQIVGVLPRVKRRLGAELRYEDVTDWRLPLGNSDIATEIVAAMDDPGYILDMPAHPGAREVVNSLYVSNRIHVITARPPDADMYTQQWLDSHGFSVDGVLSVKEKTKSFHATDVLVDDYLGNIEEYLDNTNGVAILVDQPWNRDHDHLGRYVDEGRLRIVGSIREVPGQIAQIRERSQQQAHT